MKHRDKIVPMVVALPLFLQNMDSSILGTALTSIAASLHTDPLQLNLAVTAYLISLAIFLPASAWIADRFGPRRVFCSAIVVFSIASGLCGAADSLAVLIAFRVLQGAGGAMMIPVGRLILLRCVVPELMVAAMVWFTVPPVLGRMLGPLVGGLTVTWLSWRWIFLMNVPLGVIGMALALALLDADGEQAETPSFDIPGFMLLGVGLASFLGALEGAISQLLPGPEAMLLAAAGLVCLTAYCCHSARTAAPLIDLRILHGSTFFASVVGAAPLRMAIGAVPFLLPLLFQLGFGLSPLDSGLLSMGTAVGSLATRLVLAVSIRQFGYRPLLLGATMCTSVSFVMYGLFRDSTPHALLWAAMAAGGLLVSMVMVTLQTLAYEDIPDKWMSHATALATVAQQLSFSFGILLSVELLRMAAWWRAGSALALQTGDFSLVFFSIAAIVLLSLLSFARLPASLGERLRGG